MKNYLFVMRHLPHVDSRLQETLDQLLTTAAFDQAVSLLFIDDGILQLPSGQNPAHSARKDTAAVFKALEIYDVHRLFAERESLLERGVRAEDLMLPVQLVTRAEVADLFKSSDVVVPD